MQTILELGVATTTSLVVAESLKLDNLWTALITFGISIITVVGGEFIKFLVAFFRKKTKDLEEVYKASDCLISLSLEDIYGHTVNEGMAKGLPVIASNKIVAANHLIKNGYNGYIVAPKDKKAIDEAIDNIENIDRNNCLLTSRENTFEKQAKRISEIIKSGKL